MCAAYVSGGLPPDRFWEITPRLFAIEMRGVQKRLERDRRDRITLAWETAILSRAKTVPSLDKLLNPRPERQSPQVLQAAFDALAAAWGAEAA